jgi:hypothetical protein
MHFYANDEASLRYECFGWWLADLVDIAKIGRIPKPAVSISGTFDQQSQLRSEEPTTPRHQMNKTHENKITLDSEDNTIINKSSVRDGNIPYQIEYNATVSPLVDGCSIQTPSSKITAEDENAFENSARSKRQLVALINAHSTNHKLEKLLDQESQRQATLTRLNRQLEISRASKRSVKYLSDFKTRLQNDWTSQMEEERTGLSPFVKLALSIEHDHDRKLEESRCALLQAFRELDLRLRALQKDARQLQVDINRLQQDFQVRSTFQLPCYTSLNFSPPKFLISVGNRSTPKVGCLAAVPQIKI